MGAKGTSKYCCEGEIKQSSSGPYTVKEVNNFYDILIEFHNTGHVQRISTVAIKNNTVTDWSVYSEEKCIERMQLKRPEFDFSEFKYSSSKTKSIVKCPEHGAWETSYEKIMAGGGCPKCRGYYQSTDDVLLKLKKVHGDTYDFSKVKYVKSSEKVEVICPTHGSWFAAVKTLLKGHGCSKCFIERNTGQKRSNTEEFIAKAKEVHGEKYDYSKVEYVSANQKVSIFCKKHGEYFTQAPSSHLSGNGCPACGREALSAAQAMDIADFKSRARAIHKDRYDYSLVVHSNAWPKVSIICKQHGKFEQSIHSHLLGSNCPECKKEVVSFKVSKGIEYYLPLLKERLGDTYEILPYTGRKCKRETELSVRCLCCGKVFERTVDALLKPSGCECQRTTGGFSSDVEGYIYVMCSNRLVKIGVSQDVEARLSQLNRVAPEPFQLLTKIQARGRVCLDVEKSSHKHLRALGYSSPVERFEGSTECFYDVDPEYCTALVDKIYNERIKLDA